MSKNFLELAIERLIGDGIITQKELDQRIEVEHAKNPIPAMQEDDAFLFYDSMAKEYKIQELEQNNAELTYLIMIGGK